MEMKIGIWALSKVLSWSSSETACLSQSKPLALASEYAGTSIAMDNIASWYEGLFLKPLLLESIILTPRSYDVSSGASCKKSGSSIIRVPCDVITPEWCVWSVWCDVVNTRAPCDEPCVNSCPVWSGTKLTPAAAGSLQILFYNETRTAQLG